MQITCLCYCNVEGSYGSEQLAADVAKLRDLNKKLVNIVSRIFHYALRDIYLTIELIVRVDAFFWVLCVCFKKSSRISLQVNDCVLEMADNSKLKGDFK